MDRLDTWLNAQRGWRRFALTWLYFYPPGWLVGNAWVVWGNFNSDKAPGAGYVYRIAVLAVPVALLLAGLMLPVQTLQARYLARRGKTGKPAFMWRWAVYAILLAIGLTCQGFAINQGIGWKRQHHLAGLIPLVFSGCALAVALEGGRYTRRVQKQLAHTLMADTPPFPGGGQPLG